MVAYHHQCLAWLSLLCVNVHVIVGRATALLVFLVDLLHLLLNINGDGFFRNCPNLKLHNLCNGHTCCMVAHHKAFLTYVFPLLYFFVLRILKSLFFLIVRETIFTLSVNPSFASRPSLRTYRFSNLLINLCWHWQDLSRLTPPSCRLMSRQRRGRPSVATKRCSAPPHAG